MENWTTRTSFTHQTMASTLVKIFTAYLFVADPGNHVTFHPRDHSRKWEQQLWKTVDMRSTDLSCKTIWSCSVECLGILLFGWSLVGCSF